MTSNEISASYLAIVCEICFEDVLNICRVSSANLTSEETKQSITCVLVCKISHVMVQFLEIDQLVYYCACYRVVSLSLPENWSAIEPDYGYNKSYTYD